MTERLAAVWDGLTAAAFPLYPASRTAALGTDCGKGRSGESPERHEGAALSAQHYRTMAVRSTATTVGSGGSSAPFFTETQNI